MIEVESKAEALGGTTGTWILFQEKGKTTEGFRPESVGSSLSYSCPWLECSVSCVTGKTILENSLALSDKIAIAYTYTDS